MDFHALARRDLQALCKKNQIPANLTNIAMADALASLQQVEGLKEFLNPNEHDATQSPEKEKPLTPVITRSMTRASARRRTALEPGTEQPPSCTTARPSMRSRNAVVADKECKVLNFVQTPAVSRTKKRAEAASVQLKVEKEKAEDKKNEEGDVVADGTVYTETKTRQGKTRASVTQSTRMYTRRSTRLLEKKMNDLKLSNEEATRYLEPIKMGDLAEEKDLTVETDDSSKDDHPSESVKEDPEAEIVACEVEALVEVGSEIEAEGESESGEICEKSETKAAESEVDAAPVEVECESNIPDSQLMDNDQGKKSNEFTKEAQEEKEMYNDSEYVANEVEAVSKVKEDMKSCSTEISGKKEVIAAESDVDAAPVEVECESNIPDSQLIDNDQGKKSNEFAKEAKEEKEMYNDSEYVANEVEALVEAVSKVREDMKRCSTEISGKKEVIAAESDVDAPVEVENDSKIQNSPVIVKIQAEKFDEIDESLGGASQEGLTSVEEAANGHGHVDLMGNVAPKDGDGVSELTAQVTSLHLNCLEEDCNEDVDSEKVVIPTVPDVNASFMEDDDDVVLAGYLADTDAVSESTTKVELLNELEIHGAALSEQTNNPITNTAAKMEFFDNIGQSVHVHVTEAEELARARPRNQKSVETVDMQISEGGFETVKDSNLVGANDSKVELRGEDIFSKKTPASIKKTKKVPLSPLSVGRLTELPTPLKSSSKKKQLKDENKENVGNGVEFGKMKKITELLVAGEDNQKQPTPLQEKSLGQLKKMFKEKTMMHNEKRLALQKLPENNTMAVAGEEKDD